MRSNQQTSTETDKECNHVWVEKRSTIVPGAKIRYCPNCNTLQREIRILFWSRWMDYNGPHKQWIIDTEFKGGGLRRE